MGDGLTTSFWNDVWVDRCPLSTLFPELYSVNSQQNATVGEIYQEGIWELRFRRNLNEEGRAQLTELLSKIQSVALKEEHDKVVWPHAKKKLFTARSMYRLLTFGGGG